MLKGSVAIILSLLFCLSLFSTAFASNLDIVSPVAPVNNSTNERPVATNNSTEVNVDLLSWGLVLNSVYYGLSIVSLSFVYWVMATPDDDTDDSDGARKGVALSHMNKDSQHVPKVEKKEVLDRTVWLKMAVWNVVCYYALYDRRTLRFTESFPTYHVTITCLKVIDACVSGLWMHIVSCFIPRMFLLNAKRPSLAEERLAVKSMSDSQLAAHYRAFEIKHFCFSFITKAILMGICVRFGGIEIMNSIFAVILFAFILFAVEPYKSCLALVILLMIYFSLISLWSA